MRYVLITFILVVGVEVNAQSVFVSPKSSPIWGRTSEMAKVSVSYKNIEALYLFSDATPNITGRIYRGSFFGIFYYPINIKKYGIQFSGGGGYFFKHYPIITGSKINFSIKAKYEIIKNIFIEYSHISNGFGYFNSFNPGTDHIGISVKI